MLGRGDLAIERGEHGRGRVLVGGRAGRRVHAAYGGRGGGQRRRRRHGRQVLMLRIAGGAIAGRTRRRLHGRVRVVVVVVVVIAGGCGSRGQECRVIHAVVGSSSSGGGRSGSLELLGASHDAQRLAFGLGGGHALGGRDGLRRRLGGGGKLRLEGLQMCAALSESGREAGGRVAVYGARVHLSDELTRGSLGRRQESGAGVVVLPLVVVFRVVVWAESERRGGLGAVATLVLLDVVAHDLLLVLGELLALLVVALGARDVLHALEAVDGEALAGAVEALVGVAQLGELGLELGQRLSEVGALLLLLDAVVVALLVARRVLGRVHERHVLLPHVRPLVQHAVQLLVLHVAVAQLLQLLLVLVEQLLVVRVRVQQVSVRSFVQRE